MIPKYEAIAADIRRTIEDGALKPGDKLPTVVEFCKLYNVSKITVKRAIEQITEEGLITSRRGSGTYVKDSFYGWQGDDKDGTGIYVFVFIWHVVRFYYSCFY